MVRAILFLALYLAVLLAATLFFFGSLSLLKGCGGVSSVVCDGARFIGPGLSVVLIAAITVIALALCELWLINRRLAELGRDPRTVSVWNKLFGTTLLISLVLTLPKERSEKAP